MTILTIDVGGTNIKMQAEGWKETIKFKSGEKLSAKSMCKKVIKELGNEFVKITRISIGYPGVCKNNKIVAEPKNLGKGWKGFDFSKAFGMPCRVINDAAMQAIGSHKGGKMLFLSLGTGLGTAIIHNDHVLPIEGGHLPFKNNKSFEQYVGVKGLKHFGKKKWATNVFAAVKILSDAFQPDYVVIGGGNVTELNELPDNIMQGSNKLAILGGFSLWRKKWIYP